MVEDIEDEPQIVPSPPRPSKRTIQAGKPQEEQAGETQPKPQLRAGSASPEPKRGPTDRPDTGVVRKTATKAPSGKPMVSSREEEPNRARRALHSNWSGSQESTESRQANLSSTQGSFCWSRKDQQEEDRWFVEKTQGRQGHSDQPGAHSRKAPPSFQTVLGSH